jgi:hypothetical protein
MSFIITEPTLPDLMLKQMQELAINQFLNTATTTNLQMFSISFAKRSLKAGKAFLHVSDLY